MSDLALTGNYYPLFASFRSSFPLILQVGDDGSVLAATEDEVFQSLVGGSSGGLSSFDAEGSDGNEEDDDEEGSYADSEDEDSDGKPDVCKFMKPGFKKFTRLLFLTHSPFSWVSCLLVVSSLSGFHSSTLLNILHPSQNPHRLSADAQSFPFSSPFWSF